ncbi:lipopolysaccharide transport system permease protein [Microbulbifer thermotolerans]|uniref:ABC transporter permease n=1 Tax=Microbulbifer thermotolerans TaxID=252514 RepID=UPI0008DFBD24|nr:ABC transporter permease [Microbulbifer thermotolerans]MCX2794492.1 ABC transporter permease [Microbulbifer thermotolerans]SFB89803.1 lipopolysaccharide transport system permease protein [Microbulbifer thermotolerans]
MIPVSKRYRDYIYYKSVSDLFSEASRTYLSFLWWILEPLLMLAVYYVVFGVLLKRGGDGFIPFLLIGLVVVQWFNHAVSASTNAIINKKGLINQLCFPKLVLPSAVVISCSLKFAVVFLLLVFLLIVIGYTPTLYFLQVLPLLIIMFYFIWSCCALISLLVAYIPDFSHIIPNAVRLTTYLSAVFYSVSDVPDNFQAYFYFNPMAMIIEGIRGCILYNQIIDWQYFLVLSSAVFVLVFVVFYIYRKLDAVLPNVVGQH